MKSLFIRDLGEHKGDVITSFFAVTTIQLRNRKTGEPYLLMTLCDRTGTIPAKMWDPTDEARALGEGDLVKVQGRLGEYQGRAEITVEKIRKTREEETDIADFLPVTKCDIPALWAELTANVDNVGSAEIRELLQVVIHEPAIAALMKKAPAAKAHHHAFIGGLLEHIVSLCRFASAASALYPWLNRDLLIAAAVLHDIGKIYELTWTTTFAYTDRGKLVGHINIGVQIVRAAANRVSAISDETALILEHLVLSHHGKLEWGSPVEPACAEAVLFHFLDNVDAHLAAIKDYIDQHDARLWTARVPAIGRSVLRTDAYLKEPSA